VGINNYYRLIEVVNSDTNNSIYTIDDELEDGKKIAVTLYSRDSLSTGDSVSVFLQSIDKASYDYFNTLLEISSDGQSTTPANPNTNISNGALGYFNAYAVRTKYMIVP
jgi:hypothetical protein